VSAAGNVLTVGVDGPGDFSTYRLSLVNSRTDPTPPKGIDALLAGVDFSFKVDCPSDFDCEAPSPTAAAPAATAPPIDYLAKDFASFRRLVLDRLSVLVPTWIERNPADLGMTIVEVMAYAADQLSYFQDAVATEAYLGTARRRSSVRRHARLVDYFVHDGTNARAWVCFTVQRDIGSTADPAVGTSTKLLTGPGKAVAVDPLALGVELARSTVVFETLHDVPCLTTARNAVRFYTWGDRGCWLPAGATAATLDGTAADLQLSAGDVLVIEEVLGADTGRPADADPAHRQAVRLKADPVERTDPVTKRTVLDVAWYDQDALAFSLSLAEFNQVPAALVRANVVLADHGVTVAPEHLAAPTAPRDRPMLGQAGLTQWMPYVDADARLQPAAAAVVADLRKVMPYATLHADGVNWRVQRDLLSSDRFAAGFVAETENDGRAYLRFGDGVDGRQPEPGTELVVRYRVGSGQAGNVGAEAIQRIVAGGDLATAVIAVRNPIPALGGLDPEPLEHVRLAAPAAFRTQERAVTEDDYARVAERHPEVQRAVATSRWTGSWHTMFVTVERRAGRPVDRAFATELRAFLDPFRLAGYDLEIDSPRWVSLDIALTVCVAPGYVRANVRQALILAFSPADLPDGRRGFFHPDNFTFGQPVYLSQVVATAMALPGVTWVDTDDAIGKPNRFQRWGKDPHGELAAGRIAFGRLEIARLDNDPSQPEHGQIEFFVEGGL
jgi:hypothetical protein